MTREERQYFYSCLQKMFAEWVVEHEEEWIYLNSKNLMSFADRYMETITGQQPLPQAVFRLFLEEYTPVFKGIDNKQDKADDGLDTDDKTVVGAINELREAVINSGGGGEGAKEVIEVLNEEELNQLKDPSREVIYITLDTGMLYIYDGETFVNVTNQEVDNTIYVNSTDDLLDREYTKAGIYTVVVVSNLLVVKTSSVYTLHVTQRKTPSKTTYRLKLSNNDGWAEEATDSLGNKSWDWHYYAYEEDVQEVKQSVDDLLPLIYAGL